MSVVKLDIFKATGDYLMATLQTPDPGNADPNKRYPNGILPADLNLPGLAWFDKQMGQFTNPELSYAIPLPCILMEFQQFEWYTVGKNQQRGNGNIKFWIYYENYADAFTGSINQSLATQFFIFTNQAHLALQGFAIANIMSSLDRATDAEDAAEDMIITSTVEYGTIITDNSTKADRKYVITNPAVSVTKVDQTSRPVRPGFKDGFVVK